LTKCDLGKFARHPRLIQSGRFNDLASFAAKQDDDHLPASASTFDAAAERRTYLEKELHLEIVLKGPAKNAIDVEFMDSLLDRLRRAGDAPLLLTGDGDAFSAGLNLKKVVALDAEGLAVFLGKFDYLAEALFLHAGPTVACINGHAIAGGCVLALCCDYRVALDDPQIRIGLNEAALGVEFPPKAFAIVRERIPTQFLHRVLLGADLYSPEKALALGLIDEISSDALTVSRHTLEKLARRFPSTYAAMKKDLNVMPANLDREYHLRGLAVRWDAPEVKRRLAEALKK
jgi:enoyl-CoA hydratase